MEFSKLRHYVFFGVLIAVTTAFLYVIRPFAYSIFWAAVIATLFYPLYYWLAKKIRNKTASSLITLAAVVIVIIIPISLIASLLVKESLDIYESLSNSQSSWTRSIQGVFNYLKDNPITQRLNIDEREVTAKLTEMGRSASQYIFTALKNFTQNSVKFIAMFIIMLYTLFFFLRDGDSLLKKLMHLSPLGDKHELLLYKKFTSTARATLKGTFIIALVQGFIGGLLFKLVGISGALIWGIIMVVLSVIPSLGSYIIWVPAAVIMFMLGETWQAVVILLAGVLVISTVDNLLRPILVGKDTQMHPLLILFSTLGGLLLFGVSGFVIGPIITAFFISLWEMYEHYYKQNLENDDGE